VGLLSLDQSTEIVSRVSGLEGEMVPDDGEIVSQDALEDAVQENVFGPPAETSM
jgi:hypothetical protein